MRELDKDKFVSDLMSKIGTETRWRHQGKDPNVGLDCLGFPRWGFMQQFDMPTDLESELLAYHRRPDGQKLLRTIRQWFDEFPVSARQKADLVVIYDRRNPQHIAIATDEIHVVEAYASGLTMKIVYWPLGTWRETAGAFRFPTEGEKAGLWRK